MNRSKSTKEEDNPSVFFQTQGKFSKKCGVCVLNNMLGNDIFTSQRLDQICKLLSDSLINPYKSLFGGDYDVSVLIYALNFLEKEVKWIKPNDSFREEMNNPNCIGFLFNMVLGKRNLLMKVFDYSGRHWTCVRKCALGLFYFDSSQSTVKEYENDESLINEMEKLRETGVIILSVMGKESQSIILEEEGEENSDSQKEIEQEKKNSQQFQILQ